MEDKYLFSKTNFKNGLISIRGFFDSFNNCLGEVNGRKVYLFCLWFDQNLNIKKIEISNMGPIVEEEIFNAFIDIENIKLEGNKLMLLKPERLLYAASNEYLDLAKEIEKKLYNLGSIEFGYNPIGATKYPNITIDNKKIITQNSLLLPDLLIDPLVWRFCQLKCFFLFYKKFYSIKKVIKYDKKEDTFIFGA